jgi:diadenosine tetraphosphatase ApaH/serine/threonine PP2A family protein phosphatase
MRRTPNAAELVVCPQSEIEISYRDHERVLVNVGSVGQPRDEDPRAAYGLVDTEQQIVHVRRVPYDIAAVQAKIRSVGLPEVLANRLSLGV